MVFPLSYVCTVLHDFWLLRFASNYARLLFANPPFLECAHLNERGCTNDKPTRVVDMTVSLVIVRCDASAVT